LAVIADHDPAAVPDLALDTMAKQLSGAGCPSRPQNSAVEFDQGRSARPVFRQPALARPVVPKTTTRCILPAASIMIAVPSASVVTAGKMPRRPMRAMPNPCDARD
jgi:hypothetical protein